MPQRTNDFQKLVKIINGHLAPLGARITESAMLYDSEAEIDREVDILVEAEYLNCLIKIGIECTATRRPLDSKVIEGFKEKHRKLGIQQTIVVSKNGFYEPAKKYAKKNNIKLLTFSVASKEKWLKIYERLDGLSIYSRTYFLRGISLIIDAAKVDPNFEIGNSAQVLLGGKLISAAEFATNLFKSSDASRRAFKELKDNEDKAEDPWVKIGFDLQEKIEFKDQGERSAWPKEMIVVFGYRSKYRSLNVGEVSYDGNSLVAGGFLDKKSGDSAHVAIGEDSGKLVGTLEISESMFPKDPRLPKKAERRE